MSNTVNTFILQTKSLKVCLTNKGASIHSVTYPSASGENISLALPLSDASMHGSEPSLTGCTLGPCAGRISNGHLKIHNSTYELTKNEGKNHIHGGLHNVSSKIWNVASYLPDNEIPSVSFSCDLEDGTDGYPGNRKITVIYSLCNDSIDITYRTESDQATWLCISNHTYWNLSGDFTKDSYDQTFQMDCPFVQFNDAESIPVSKEDVTGTPFDFRTPHSFREYIDQRPAHPQIKIGRGFNNGFILTKVSHFSPNKQESDSVKPAATLASKETGIRMRLYTDYPALVVYSAGYLDASTTLTEGISATPGCAIALEAEEWPDTPNFPGAPFKILEAGETLERHISFAFDHDSLRR